MWSAAISAILAVLRALFGGKPSDPAVPLATQAATAQTELRQQEAANDILREGSAARAASDDEQLRGDNGPAGAVNTDPDAPVNRSPDAHFRD